MFEPLDIFRTNSDGSILWRGSVETLAAARAAIQKLAASAPGEYFILDQHTGKRISVAPDDSQDSEAKFSYLSFLRQA
jgi:hypothetical protein